MIKLALVAILSVLSTNLAFAKPLIKVLVIDSGLNADKTNASLCNKHLDFLQGSKVLTRPAMDHLGHGTNMVNIISSKVNPKHYCIMTARLLDGTTSKNVRDNKFFLDISTFAIQNGVRLVNYSITGTSPIFEEKMMFQRLVKAGILVNVAAGNSSSELTIKRCFEYPACYRMNGLVSVGAMDGTYLLSSSNYGPVVDIFAQGVYTFSNATKDQGTSVATAVYTNKILRSLIGD
jgi:hypothetical protein